MEVHNIHWNMLITLLVGVLCAGLVCSQQDHRVVCYTASWAHYRHGPVQFDPEDIDTSLCTHINFAFGFLDKTGVNFVPADPGLDVQMYTRLTSLKRRKASLKVLLSLGGWTMGSEEFTVAVSSQDKMHTFARNAIDYLHRYGFDGLDIDWEYPAARGSPPEDKHRFTQLLQTVKREFARDHSSTGRGPLLLSVAIASSPYRVGISYELPQIADSLDFINVMTYDMHGGDWDDKTGHHSPLYSSTSDKSDSIDYLIQTMLSTGVPAKKLNLGLSFYGNSFDLSDPNNRGVGAPINGPGAGGEYLGSEGTLAYFEVCKLLTAHRDTVTESGRLGNTQAPYVVDGHRWTGYDDAQSIKEKVRYVLQNGLGGVFIWTIDMDDFHNICGGGSYPLMNAIRDQYHQGLVGR